ncbi:MULTISPECIES: STAS domain-containing protein [Ferrimonas]|uniref:STAS domain-containing protein n=1 Tax=Ferrimonas TaxID=44011 RepID=UPI000402AC35|nr:MULTISPECIES: STAS domain-containing protein [Ferrimonas]USD38067.1 STAS domain-containing protein [Ferrimonas sp. SCSIO 43195]
MDMRTEKRDGYLVISLEQSRLDAASAPGFRSGVETAISEGNQRIVLDLSKVNFMDSSGLGAVVAVLKTPNCGELRIVGLQRAVQELFRLTRMDRIFECHDDVPAALKAVKA